MVYNSSTKMLSQWYTSINPFKSIVCYLNLSRIIQAYSINSASVHYHYTPSYTQYTYPKISSSMHLLFSLQYLMVVN